MTYIGNLLVVRNFVSDRDTCFRKLFEHLNTFLYHRSAVVVLSVAAFLDRLEGSS